MESGKFRVAQRLILERNTLSRQHLVVSWPEFPRDFDSSGHLPVQVTHTLGNIFGRGGFPSCKHSINLKGPVHRDQRARRQGAWPSGSIRRQSPGKRRQSRPWFQDTNYRLDSQVSITWTGSLSLPLFPFSSVLSWLAPLHIFPLKWPNQSVLTTITAACISTFSKVEVKEGTFSVVVSQFPYDHHDIIFIFIMLSYES